MPINNYLINRINPANRENEVLVNKAIRIHFAKHMKVDSVENDYNIMLHKVNGERVKVKLEYSREGMFLDVTPAVEDENGILIVEDKDGVRVAVLEHATQYEVHVKGGDDGVVSILDEYMQSSRTYEFTTGSTEPIGKPLNLTANGNAGLTTVQWEAPTGATTKMHYEVLISTINIAPARPESYIWPDSPRAHMQYKTTLSISDSFTEHEGPYYAYVRAVDGELEGPWEAEQFIIEETPTEVEPPSDVESPDSTFENAMTSIELSDSYPRAGSANITPEEVILVFSEEVHSDVLMDGNKWVYIVPRGVPKNRSLSLVDFMTDFSFAKAIVATRVLDKDDKKILKLQADFMNDAEYTIVISSKLKGQQVRELGVPQTIPFTTTYSRLYGDADLVRKDMGSFSDDLDDETLYKYLHDNSVYAYELVSRMASFAEGDYSEGRAPFYMHQYVRLKTLHDLLLHTQLHKDNGGAVKNISLGDLTVAKETDSGGTSLNSLLTQVRNRLKPFMDMMQGHNNRGYAKPSMVVRGESGQTEPTFLSRSEYRELGQ